MIMDRERPGRESYIGPVMDKQFYLMTDIYQLRVRSCSNITTSKPPDYSVSARSSRFHLALGNSTTHRISHRYLVAEPIRLQLSALLLDLSHGVEIITELVADDRRRQIEPADIHNNMEPSGISSKLVWTRCERSHCGQCVVFCWFVIVSQHRLTQRKPTSGTISTACVASFTLCSSNGRYGDDVLFAGRRRSGLSSTRQ